MKDKIAMEDKNYNAGQSREAVILKTATTVWPSRYITTADQL